MRLSAWAILASLFAHAQASPQARQTCCRTLTRDVVVLGGGSSGTYAAVRLHDEGKSVVVVEARHELGGHTETYKDPTTGGIDNIGVQSFHNISVTHDYFARLGVPLTANIMGESPVPTLYYDFHEEKIVNNYSMPDPTPGLGAFMQQLALYPELSEGFDALPTPVPGDLLLPFGKFARKYDIESAMFLLALSGQGGIDYQTIPAMYILKQSGPTWINAITTGGLTTESHNNQDIYNAAYDIIGSQNVLLNSRVESSTRDSSGVKLKVRSTDGASCFDITAEKLIVAFPPKLDSMQPFDPDATESDLFSRFSNSAYYTAVVRMESLPPWTPIFGTGASTPFNLARLPSPLTITPAPIPGLIDVKYGASAESLSDDDVRARIAADLRSVAAAAGNGSNVVEDPEFLVFRKHAPFQPTVSVEDIADGFYKKLWGLQGHRSTFYTGATWQAQDSSILWNFTEHRVLPLLLG